MVTEETLTTEIATPASAQPQTPEPRRLIEIISDHLETLRTHHRAVLETDSVEAVHKMRVSTRKLQAAIDLLGKQAKVRTLKTRLRRWRRALSRVRNYDVFLELIEKETAGRGKARREQLQLITNILRERRVRRAAKVRQFLERADIDAIAVKLGFNPTAVPQPLSPDLTGDDLLGGRPAVDPAPPTDEFDERKVVKFAAERLDQRLEEFQALVAKSHPATHPAELHKLRIAAKRVRYLLEIISQMGIGDAAGALTWLRTLQDRIGDWHDLEALEEEIIIILSSGEFMKQHLAESGGMLLAAAHLQKKKAVLVSRLFPVKVPRYLTTTSQRMARALRRRAKRD
ncbi:MAG: CHAD domain-containing protein [Blastocatellia bacterium]